jgi:hypothetical protein
MRLGCFNKCKEGFNQSSTECQVCRGECTEFGFQDHWTSSCSSKSEVCLENYFRRVGLIKRDFMDEEAIICLSKMRFEMILIFSMDDASSDACLCCHKRIDRSSYVVRLSSGKVLDKE